MCLKVSLRFTDLSSVRVPFFWAALFNSTDTIRFDFGEGLKLGAQEYDSLYKITMIEQLATETFYHF